MKKTGINNKVNWLYISSLILLILMTFIFIIIFIKSYQIFKIESDSIHILPMIVFGIFSVFTSITLILHLLGKLIGNIKITKNKIKVRLDNPYIYYRELPNNYGIGICSLLIDSKIENEKDIVAIILNLCAKKYLSLKKENDTYTIKVLKNIDNNLLSNEKYIISSILYNSIDKFNYNEWFNYCMQDGITLGLYKQPNEKQYIKKIEQNPISNMYKNALNGGYNSKIINYLEPTEKGIQEIKKLYAFKKFIKDFGNFANKRPEEILLWDYYLCYAQVFGLTDQILKTGYTELIKNGAFQIESISSIHLNNLKIIK